MKAFFDEFSTYLASEGVEIPGKLEKSSGVFADILGWGEKWKMPEEIIEKAKFPGIKIQTDTRWIVLDRIKGEIRFYAEYYHNAKRCDKGKIWYRDTIDTEMGIVLSISDAVLFTIQFFREKSFKDIAAKRIPPSWKR